MRIGVLLGGCGLYDGSDVHETVLTLLALELAGEKPLLTAPDRPQERTVDHLTGDEVPEERRGMLRESARLSRTPVRALGDVRPEELESLIIPGGYGPVVNFTTGFARRGRPHEIVPEVGRFIGHFLEAGKPIGMVGLGEVPVRMVLGQELDMPGPTDRPSRLIVDPDRPVIHTPGFAGSTRFADVKAGIEAMVAEVIRLMDEGARGRTGPAGDGGVP